MSCRGLGCIYISFVISARYSEFSNWHHLCSSFFAVWEKNTKIGFFITEAATAVTWFQSAGATGMEQRFPI
jgi:hypothetical protein